MENPVVQKRLTRKSGWRERLHAALIPLTSAPFAWQDNDCASGLGCIVVKALTGADLKEGWPSYRTEKAAIKAMRQRGFADLSEAVGSFLPEIPRLSAQIGDLALLKTSGQLGYALGMVNTSTILVMTETGLGHTAWDDVVKVFRVGEYEETTTP